MSEQVETADVIVVGAGPGGSATAAYLAQHGLDVLLLEKATFPRDKICGDGLTPRAVRELINLGVPTRPEDGWHRTRGLRIVGGGVRMELDWPGNETFPPFGLVRTRMDLDETLARHAERRGARLLQGMNVSGPILDHRDHIVGVTAKVMGPNGRATGATREFRARVVVAADGNSSRLSLAMDRPKRDDRPMGVAVRSYFSTPRHDDGYLESWLELWTQDEAGARHLMPGYGWIFPLGDGTANVGLGILDTFKDFGNFDSREVMRRWVAEMPEDWGFSEETRLAPIRGAALPMCFNRQPLYDRGLLLVGDAGGMVNPFNGEGIAEAMEAGRYGAEIIASALARATPGETEAVLRSYPKVMKDALGGYFMLGKQFATLIGHPEVMRLAVRYGLPRKALMRLLIKIMANLPQERGGRLDDRVINALSRMTPAA
ncbi:geranylgeranyl reductase family protein [Ornithinimicrobium pratense]|uniref:Geranylgeranyl reductase family protein n=1 Tax=Ornithinimicrobium pratense TaxID=2593973 RepID=A0A5J6V786_9MICO|nr:geranylgeranyl reductase family protein [Ornithinimicrobium pratense]QFG69407.1 geranylgeranyl reductase family protein [Ornithinimicrobium pratense]